MWVLSALLLFLLPFLVRSASPTDVVAAAPAADEPAAPGLTYLYTAYAECQGTYSITGGPRGDRRVIPIVGGNFTGPRLKGSHELPLKAVSPTAGNARRFGC